MLKLPTFVLQLLSAMRVDLYFAGRFILWQLLSAVRVAQEFLALAYTIDQSFSAATLSLYFGSRSIL
jgi:hypothetical protein